MATKEPFQFEKKFEVLSFQIDPFGKLRWSALGDLMQEVAWKHADSRDFGQSLFDKGYMWVLSRMQIKVHSMPSWGDHIVVKTAGRGIDKLFALREFLVEDDKGNVIAESMSAWLLLDVRSKRPQRPNQVLPPELFSQNPEKGLLPEKLESAGSFEKSTELTVRPFDLDMNNHVNNVSYIRWVEDLCISEGIVFHDLVINYIAEAKLHESIFLSMSQQDQYFLLSGTSQNRPVLLVSVK
ncbi:acyl-[acyl-carrier-protein] thioesterase [Cognataquiflexum rubidum]|uniref:acyl-[acyl-carrier-protein] thioesterase n=1 Tax=Cognataquiflexum rubidum TaxID=2922273 RepID=UPI001F12C1F1|nr:acyl-ACP thioesterase domain-containing protein [Cognataquiflexum rubidum]MCH6234932.1 thioesterase [Cognataquiflexum rubidum]